MSDTRNFSAATLAACIVALGGIANSRESETDFAANLFPPEITRRHSSEIQLSDKQQERITQIASDLGQSVAKLRRDIQLQNKQLSELLDEEPMNTAAALQQLNAFLSSERKLKQLHFTAMIRIRSLLSARQHADLTAKVKAERALQQSSVATQPASIETELRLRGKVERIKKEVESRAANGIPPLQAVQIMEQFPLAMKRGRVDQAEAILDRAFELLDLRPEDNSNSESADPKPVHDGDAMLPRRPEAVSLLKQPPELPSEEVQRSVKELYVEDVAWRKIEWETCLLSGLARSREERKPLVLWVFIDRPINDERC